MGYGIMHGDIDEDTIYVDLTEEEGNWMEAGREEEQYFSERSVDSRDFDEVRSKLLNLYLDRASEGTLSSRKDLNNLLTECLSDKADEAVSIADRLDYDPA